MLHTAARCKLGANILQMMIKAGVNINEPNKYGYTPLHLAVSCNRSAEIVKMLLDAGANKNLKNREKQTALDIARKQKNEQLIKLLTEHQ